jgi:hypothetical protein
MVYSNRRSKTSKRETENSPKETPKKKRKEKKKKEKEKEKEKRGVKGERERERERERKRKRKRKHHKNSRGLQSAKTGARPAWRISITRIRIKLFPPRGGSCSSFRE